MRRRLMVGNWKLFKTEIETSAFFGAFLPLVEQCRDCHIVVCPPFVSIPKALQATQETSVEIGAQNLFWASEGAYTGEVSGPMLRSLGCRWVIVGHSERRQYFKETNEEVCKKTSAAIAAGLRPIVCVGERLEDRESGKTKELLAEQFECGLSSLTPSEFAEVTIAYEPIWAIGTGKVATPEIAAEAHRDIRECIAARFGQEQADSTRILYGGSVKPDNVAGLMAQPELDGALVGGASLDSVQFATIIAAG